MRFLHNKYLLLVVLILSIALIMTACGGNGAAPAAEDVSETEDENGTAPLDESTFNFVQASLQPEAHIEHQVHLDFMERAERLSNGRITFDYFPAGVLGNEIDMMEQLQTGAITTARITGAPLGGIVEGYMIMNLPFLFDGPDHMLESLRSDRFASLVEERTVNEGIRPLEYWWLGVRDLYTIRPVEKIEDLSGMIIRTWQDEYVVKSFEALGASSTPISFDELYMSMETGVVDGGEGWVASYNANGFYGPAPYVTKIGYIQIASVFVISENMWQQLPDDLKEVVEQAAAENAEFALNLFSEYDRGVYDEAMENGAEIIEVTDLDKWQEATEHLFNEFGEQYGNEYAEFIDWVISIR